MENSKLLATGGRPGVSPGDAVEPPDYGGAQHIPLDTTHVTIDGEKQGEGKITCTVKELCDLMKLRGSEAREKIVADYGDVNELCCRLDTDTKNGLSDDPDVLSERVRLFGSNTIPPRETKSFFYFVWEAIQDTTLIILIVAALVSLGLSFYHPPDEMASPGDQTERQSGFIESLGIMFAVIIIVLVTAFINWSKDCQFRSLQKQLTQQFKYSVLRSGEIREVPMSEIVVGDICIIKYGDIVPADGILISSNDLNLDESSHSGESDDVIKSVDTDVSLFSGTHVIEGSGRMVVTAVGINSAKGVMFSLLGVTYDEDNKSDEKRSILHQKLVQITVQITYVGTALALLTLVILIMRFSIETFAVKKLPWRNTYFQYYVSYAIIGITVLVVSVPEGLPLAVILSLAYSIRKMMQDNNLVRHLDACETMGNATAVCSDKTGTLTANRMTVVRAYCAGRLCKNVDDFGHLPPDISLVAASAISINSSYTNTVKPTHIGTGFKYTSRGPIGNKTECALLSFAGVLGGSPDFVAIRGATPESSFVKVYTFSSQRKWMATVVPGPGQPGWPRSRKDPDRLCEGYRVYVKGAAEIVLERCEWMLGADLQLLPLSDVERKGLNAGVIDNMASVGLRTIAIAYRDIVPDEDGLPNWDDENDVINKLVCIAITGIEDPVRPEVPLAIRRCQRAGITVRMVTGDSIKTARYVAVKCGILDPTADDDVLVLDGKEFNRLVRPKPDEPVDQAMMDEVWPRLRVLARSSPEDKYTLVKGIMDSRLEGKRQIVAVTGDGTNDAPALRKAHVGLAMGEAGTDIAKEASDIILIDDNFASIVKSVMWGRHIYDSIAKFLQFQLTVNVVAVLLALIGACVIADSPLKGIQMLWVNLLMDTLASLSLATEEPVEEELLRRQPYGYDQHIVSPLMLRHILSHSVYELTVLLILLFAGEKFIPFDSGRELYYRGMPNDHYTFVFNAFVMMILFNEFCSRKLDASPNVFSRLHRSPFFILIWVTSFAAQVLIVQFGDKVFFTTKLSLDLWLWCIFIGIGDLIYAEIVSYIAKFVTWLIEVFKRCCCRKRYGKWTPAEHTEDDNLNVYDKKPFYS